MNRLALLPFVILMAACAEPDPNLPGRASVIDGDTLELRQQRIRLWGVDAPEGRQTCRVDSQEVRCGQVAANRLDQYIDGRPVTCFAQDEDRYGRVVARCEVAGVDLGGWLVREGLAVRYARYAGTAYLIEDAQARRARRGLWAGEFETPEDWRRARRSR